MTPPEPVLDDVLQDVPVEYRERFADLLRRPIEPVDTLREQVESYIRTVRQVGPLVAFIDVDEAERITASALALIGIVRPDRPVVHRIVQAAAQYFVFEDEDEEVTGVLGFDDDIQVVNAVCRAVHRDDLVIPLKRREA